MHQSYLFAKWLSALLRRGVTVAQAGEHNTDTPAWHTWVGNRKIKAASGRYIHEALRSQACAALLRWPRVRVVPGQNKAHYDPGRLAADETVANRVRSGRKQP